MSEFKSTRCDECQRIRGESNHWHKIGVGTTNAGRAWIELGALLGPGEYIEAGYEVHDLCGDACFYKHIGKLLKLNPVEAADVV